MAKLPASAADTNKVGGSVEPPPKKTREVASNDKDSPISREERIRNAAYRRYQERGNEPGDSVADWLHAEGEINAQDGT
jgi:Protein of unknown function (DUF2934)